MSDNSQEEPKAEATPVPEETKADDSQERAKAFVQEYGELVQKHKVDFATYPMWVPDGNGGFKCIIQSTPVDITNQPVKSNFVA